MKYLRISIVILAVLLTVVSYALIQVYEKQKLLIIFVEQQQNKITEIDQAFTQYVALGIKRNALDIEFKERSTKVDEGIIRIIRTLERR